MLKKAIIYRIGSVLIGILINTILLQSIQFALFVSLVFTVVLTAYYMVFHKLWPEKPPKKDYSRYNVMGFPDGTKPMCAKCHGICRNPRYIKSHKCWVPCQKV